MRGQWYALYLFIDVWSHLIVGWEVLEFEDSALSAGLLDRICKERRVNSRGLVLHSDNGGAMKGTTMLATIQCLGIVSSFSGPHTSDDNAFSEALFRTAKYHRTYPGRFESLDAGRAWVSCNGQSVAGASASTRGFHVPPKRSSRRNFSTGFRISCGRRRAEDVGRGRRSGTGWRDESGRDCGNRRLAS